MLRHSSDTDERICSYISARQKLLIGFLQVLKPLNICHFIILIKPRRNITSSSSLMTSFLRGYPTKSLESTSFRGFAPWAPTMALSWTHFGPQGGPGPPAYHRLAFSLTLNPGSAPGHNCMKH